MKIKKTIILILVGILFFGACYAFYREQQLDKEDNIVLSQKEQEEIVDMLKEKIDDEKAHYILLIIKVMTLMMLRPLLKSYLIKNY